MRFCDFVKLLRENFACSSNERFITELFSALCGNSLPEGLKGDDPTYRKRLFGGKRYTGLSKPIKEYVLKHANLTTFTEYCELKVSSANFKSLCRDLNLDKRAGRYVVFTVLFNCLLEFAKSTKDEVAFGKPPNTDNADTEEKTDTTEIPAANDSHEKDRSGSTFERHFDFLEDKPLKMSFWGVGEVGISIVNELSSSWTKASAEVDFFCITQFDDLLKYYLAGNASECDEIAFIVVRPLEFDNTLNLAVEVAAIIRERAGIVIAFLVDAFREVSRRTAIAEDEISKLLSECSAYTIVDENNIYERTSTCGSLQKIACEFGKAISPSGFINLNFLDFKIILSGSRQFQLGHGSANGINRAFAAISVATSRPVTQPIAGEANHVIVNITGSIDIGLDDVDQVTNMVKVSASEDANIIFGVSFDDALTDAIEVVIIAATDSVISANDVKAQNKECKKDTSGTQKEFEFYEMFNKKSKGSKDVF